ncbi:MAG: metalloregulator ArsR/SmtB family transcription factor [Ectothiorhodospiraceae bacterium]|jgi:ArsR family transcriptional regulator
MTSRPEPEAQLPLRLTPENLFRTLSDGTRLRAVLLMAEEGELCVCELMVALRVSQPKMSRHLAVLRDAGVVSDRRDSVWIHYRIANDLPVWARRIIQETAERCRGMEPFIADGQRLHRMPDRPGRRCLS